MKNLVALMFVVLAFGCGDAEKKEPSNNANNGSNNVSSNASNNGNIGSNNVLNNGANNSNNGSNNASNNGANNSNNGTDPGPACERFQPTIEAVFEEQPLENGGTIGLAQPSVIYFTAPVEFTGASEVVAWRWQTATAEGPLVWLDSKDTDTQSIEVIQGGSYMVRATAWDQIGLEGPGCTTSFEFEVSLVP